MWSFRHIKMAKNMKMEQKYVLLFMFISLSFCVFIIGSNDVTKSDKTTLSDVIHRDHDDNDSLLPETWHEMCSAEKITKQSVHVRCNVNASTSGMWRMDTLKYWINTFNVKYYFKIYCKDGSNISVPWPIKAKNLVGIEVYKCTITDFFSDTNIAFSTQEPPPDQLTILKLVHSSIRVSLMGFISYMMNAEHLSQDFDCGHEETLQELTWRNVTYTFDEQEIKNAMKAMDSDDTSDKNDTESPLSKISQVGTEFLDKIRRIKHTCDYKHLRYVDGSINDDKSKYYMSTLTENSFFPELEVYNVSRNSETKIHEQFQKWWRYFPKLKVLDMSNNFVSTIDFDSSTGAWGTDLLHVNLTYNNVTFLSSSTVHLLGEIPNLFVDLRENPFHCECSPEMKNLLKLLREHDLWMTKSYSRYKYLQKLVCRSPKNAMGKMFLDLSEADLSCPAYSSSVAPVVCLSVSVVILVVVIILVTKFRKEVLILTYTRLNIILPCQPRDTSLSSKTYDAFVSYSSDDEIWVTKTFQGLEETSQFQPNAFKFCLHQRDFIAGKTIFDNVIDSVEASRHTVIVLSKNFLKSHWCLYEFHEAFQQSIVERKRHLVVIMMEYIPEKDMPKELKRCLKTFTYIRKDDVIFNDRLLYALSCKNRKSSSLENGIQNTNDAKVDIIKSIPLKDEKHTFNELTHGGKIVQMDESTVSSETLELYV